MFPGGKTGASRKSPGGFAGLSNMAMVAVLRRMKRAELTVHGFRSSFRDWCAEATAHPREVAGAALAHRLRDKMEEAYRRSDLFGRRAKLMGKWAAFLARSTEAGSVVPIRGRRRAAEPGRAQQGR